MTKTKMGNSKLTSKFGPDYVNPCRYRPPLPAALAHLEDELEDDSEGSEDYQANSRSKRNERSGSSQQPNRTGNKTGKTQLTISKTSPDDFNDGTQSDCSDDDDLRRSQHPKKSGIRSDSERRLDKSDMLLASIAELKSEMLLLRSEVSKNNARLEVIEDKRYNVPDSARSSSQTTSCSSVTSSVKSDKEVITWDKISYEAPKDLKSLKYISKCLIRKKATEAHERGLWLDWLTNVIYVYMTKYVYDLEDYTRHERDVFIKNIASLMMTCLRAWGVHDIQNIDTDIIGDDLKYQVSITHSFRYFKF